MKTTTFQSNGAVVYKLVWLELHRNINDSCFEKSSESPDSYCSSAVSPNMPAQIFQSPRMITSQVNRHVKFPNDKVAFLEFFGRVFDTSIILEDKLEVGLRATLHKRDRYLYVNISCLL